MRNGWVNRAAEHDSDLASRRREHTAKELERSQDDALILIRAALAKVKERIEGMDAGELAAGQIPAALRTLIELEFKVLGYEDRVALTGKDGGPVKVDTKTQHVFQPSKEVWDDILRKRAEFERLRDGDTAPVASCNTMRPRTARAVRLRALVISPPYNNSPALYPSAGNPWSRQPSGTAGATWPG